MVFSSILNAALHGIDAGGAPRRRGRRTQRRPRRGNAEDKPRRTKRDQARSDYFAGRVCRTVQVAFDFASGHYHGPAGFVRDVNGRSAIVEFEWDGRLRRIVISNEEIVEQSENN